MTKMALKLDFTGKVVLVTGAGQGNGAAIAKSFAQAGARVALIDWNLETAQAVANEIAESDGVAKAYQLDVSDHAACARVAADVQDQLGKVAVLVNNAGIIRRSNFAEGASLEDWTQTINVNLGGTYYMTIALLSQLKETHGCILNLASVQSFVSRPNSVPYTASKGGVAQLTKGLACELAPYGIRVNAIAPGVIATPMSQPSLADPVRAADLLSHVPMKRHGETSELAAPALFICSPMASYITGVILPVDGGYLSM